MSIKTIGRRARVQSSSAAPGSGRGLDKTEYRVVVMGAAAVGKTCIITRFLYHQFVESYKATVEELHQGNYDINGADVTLNVLDTAGSYNFPAMRDLSIATGDAFILVYSVDNAESFKEVTALREEIMEHKSHEHKEVVPIVIVGNKSDLEEEKRQVHRQTAESTVNIDWDNGFVEVSAKDDVNVTGIFRELLAQAKVDAPIVRRRRRSLSLHRKDKDKSNTCTVS